MAEEDENAPPQKRKRLTVTVTVPNNKVKIILSRCLEDFSTSISLIPLKIKYCNPDVSSTFSDAICDLEKPQLGAQSFSASTIFQPGIKLLQKALDGIETSMSTDEKTVIERLFSFFESIDDVSGILLIRERQGWTSKRKREAFSAVQLCHHLLGPLAEDYSYVLDHNSKYRLGHCLCCDEKITGRYGDTSIGNGKVWHGCADILLGNQKVVLKVDSDSEKMEDSEEDDISPSEVDKENPRSAHHVAQIVTETIVSAFLQKRMHLTSAENFLIPTISISKRDVMFYFYDPEFDYLLQLCSPVPLMLDSGELSPHTVLTLWLAINYPVTCSGITDRMIEKGFRADFLSHIDGHVKDVYENQLRFGCCGDKQGRDHDRNVLCSSVITDGKPVKGSYHMLNNNDSTCSS